MRRSCVVRLLLVVAATIGLSFAVLFLLLARGQANKEGFITRKSRLHEAGVRLQTPHIRALNTGGR